MKDNLIEIKANYETIAICENFTLKHKQCELEITPKLEGIVNKNWEIECAKNNKLFNGIIMCYGSHYSTESHLVVECFPIQYKYFLAQLKGVIDFNLRPLAVSGLIIDKQKNTLISKRSNTVTQCKSYYEFVPSGGIPGDSINSKLAQDQLALEFEEETNLNSELIETITPFCLILDKKNSVYDICCIMQLNGDLHNLIKSCTDGEYTHHQVINITRVEDFLNLHQMVPTSLMMYDIFKRTRMG